MIYLYLDSSALLKAFVQEKGTSDILSALGDAVFTGTAQITKVELAATFAKLTRMKVLNAYESSQALERFLEQWGAFVHMELTSVVIDQAVELTKHFPLRGYDAVQLASALIWQNFLAHPIVFATFDRRLWQTARETKLQVFPDDISPFLTK